MQRDKSYYFCKMEIYKEFSFDSAHFLPNVPVGHKCREMHGHTYRLKVFIKGGLDPNLGWIMDFKDLKDALIPVIDQLDHKLINNIGGLENPTAENITVWIWQQIKPSLPLLSRIELYETPTTGVIYAGE
jgi:6-pyruvoyltetrahydropterin/6-carboxytetrahydropterin synthase